MAKLGEVVDEEEAGLRIEAGRPVVRQAAFIRRDDAPIGEQVPSQDSEWAGHFYQLPLDQFVGPKVVVSRLFPFVRSSTKKYAIARCLHQHLARLPVKVSVNQHRRLHRIPVMRIVGRRLERPHELCQSRGSARRCCRVLEVVARTWNAVEHRARISGAPVDKVEVGGHRYRSFHAPSARGLLGLVPTGGVASHCHCVLPVSASIERMNPCRLSKSPDAPTST